MKRAALGKLPGLRRPSAARPRARRIATRGFTLLEVLVACALLAVLAVISWRGLESVLSARDRITSYSDDLRAMTVAFSQIDEDLRRSWPVRLLRLPRRPVAFAVTEGAVILSTSRSVFVETRSDPCCKV